MAFKFNPITSKFDLFPEVSPDGTPLVTEVSSGTLGNALGRPEVIGQAPAGAAFSDPVWRVRKLTYDAGGVVTKVQWCNNAGVETADFVHSWQTFLDSLIAPDVFLQMGFEGSFADQSIFKRAFSFIGGPVATIGGGFKFGTSALSNNSSGPIYSSSGISNLTQNTRLEIDFWLQVLSATVSINLNVFNWGGGASDLKLLVSRNTGNGQLGYHVQLGTNVLSGATEFTSTYHHLRFNQDGAGNFNMFKDGLVYLQGPITDTYNVVPNFNLSGAGNINYNLDDFRLRLGPELPISTAPFTPPTIPNPIPTKFTFGAV